MNQLFSMILILAMAQGSVAEEKKTIMATLNGVQVEVYPGEIKNDFVVSGTVKQQVELPFPNGNTVAVTEYFWTDGKGMITMLSSPGKITWKTSTQTIDLNCARRAYNQNRMVTFHRTTGAYKMGCQLPRVTQLEVNGQKIIAPSGADIDLHDRGELAYVSRITKADPIKIPSGDKVILPANSSLAFHKNGVPNFLLITSDYRYITQSLFGPMVMGGSAYGKVYTHFYSNGFVKKGFLLEPSIAFLGMHMVQILGNSPIIFHENGQIGLFQIALFGGTPIVLEAADGQKMQISHGDLVCINKNGFLAQKKVCEKDLM